MTKLQKTKTSIKEIEMKLKIKKNKNYNFKTKKREREDKCVFYMSWKRKEGEKTNNIGDNSTTTSRHGPFCVAKGIVAHSKR